MSQMGKYTQENIETLTGNSGGAVEQTSGNIDIVGDVTTIDVTGNPGTSTLTISAGPSTAIQFDTDTGSATPALGVLDVLGGANIATTGAGSAVTVAFDGTLPVASGGTGAVTLTDHSVLLGSGTAAITAATVGTDGQVLLGATAADAAFATLTSTGSTVTFTPGANTLNLEADVVAAGAVITVTGNSGGAISPDGAGDLGLVGGTTGLTFAGAANAQTLGGTLIVANGGTGVATMTTAYAPVCAGTTATGTLQVASTGLSTSGFILTSTGAASLPTFQAPAASSISITGDTGGALVGAAFTFTGGTTGLSFGGAGSTETVSGTLVAANGGTGRATHTAYAVICGGTTTTAPQQSIASVGTASQVLTSNGAGALPTFQAAAGGGLTWTVTTVNAGIVAGNGYISNKAGLLTMTLPASGAIGDIIEITNINTAVGFRVAQNALQAIRFSSSLTSVGVGGYLEATALGDSLKMVCTVAGTSTRWIVLSSVGNLTIV